MNNPAQSLFDNQIAGSRSDSKRWGRYPKEVLPLWVADMDFLIAPSIRKAINARVEQFPLWYSESASRHNQTVAKYLERSYNWQIDPEWVVWLPGLMAGIYQFVLGLAEDAAVVCQKPVYGQLHRAARLRREIIAPIYKVQTNGKQSWSCEFPETTSADNARALLLCHPQNPTGWVADSQTLSAIGEYAQLRDMLVVSDEIHADLVLDGEHQPFAVACPEMAQSTLTFMAASKTWNIAGLNTAFAIIPNNQIRNQLQTRLSYCGGEPVGLGVLATITALEEGGEWRQELLAYLKTSRSMIDAAIDSINGLDWIPNQAMHLGWINCRGLGENGAGELHSRLLKEGLALSNGQDFGDTQHLRINYATSHNRLAQALEILARVSNNW